MSTGVLPHPITHRLRAGILIAFPRNTDRNPQESRSQSLRRKLIGFRRNPQRVLNIRPDMSANVQELSAFPFDCPVQVATKRASVESANNWSASVSVSAIRRVELHPTSNRGQRLIVNSQFGKPVEQPT
jgi:hypothetical protein